MVTVYDVIAEICRNRQITLRRLAMSAGIPPTTLESAIQRRPERVSMRMVESIAQVFGMPWYALLTTSDDEEQVARCKNPRWVYSTIREEEAERIVRNFEVLPMLVQEASATTAQWREGTSLQSLSLEATGDEYLRQGIMVVLRKLNSDGLMEVMRHALEAASKPEYNRKGSVPCDRDGQ